MVDFRQAHTFLDLSVILSYVSKSYLNIVSMKGMFSGGIDLWSYLDLNIAHIDQAITSVHIVRYDTLYGTPWSDHYLVTLLL